VPYCVIENFVTDGLIQMDFRGTDSIEVHDTGCFFTLQLYWTLPIV